MEEWARLPSWILGYLIPFDEIKGKGRAMVPRSSRCRTRTTGMWGRIEKMKYAGERLYVFFVSFSLGLVFMKLRSHIIRLVN
jgi:hypothetical protein